MDRLRSGIGAALQELERLGQPDPPAPRLVARPLPRPRPTIDREGADAEPVPGSRDAPPPPAPPVAATQATELRAALGSRAALRQAFFLREILGPPRALQDPRGEGRGGG